MLPNIQKQINVKQKERAAILDQAITMKETTQQLIVEYNRLNKVRILMKIFHPSLIHVYLIGAAEVMWNI
jgi:hypothetical protein